MVAFEAATGVVQQSRLLPLCGGFDGTLIRTELLDQYLGRAFKSWLLLRDLSAWALAGKARLKGIRAQLGSVDRMPLLRLRPFVDRLRKEKSLSRYLALVTAADAETAMNVEACLDPLVNEVIDVAQRHERRSDRIRGEGPILGRDCGRPGGGSRGRLSAAVDAIGRWIRGVDGHDEDLLFLLIREQKWQ